MKKFFYFVALSFFVACSQSNPHPFNYELNLSTIPGENQRTMVCFHGFGGDHRIAQILKKAGVVKQRLISFNFPDFGAKNETVDPEKATFGSIDELLPALFVLKKAVVEEGVYPIDLYGISAGGAALVNLIAVLKTKFYDDKLKEIGIHRRDKKAILKAIQGGTVILDVPLKSIEEIIAHRGSSPVLESFAKRYEINRLRPIDSLQYFENLGLNVIVHFEEKDEVLSNRDDQLFIERLKKYNASGATSVVISDDGGHGKVHRSLWDFYEKMQMRY